MSSQYSSVSNFKPGPNAAILNLYYICPYFKGNGELKPHIII